MFLNIGAPLRHAYVVMPYLAVWGDFCKCEEGFERCLVNDPSNADAFSASIMCGCDTLVPCVRDWYIVYLVSLDTGEMSVKYPEIPGRDGILGNIYHGRPQGAVSFQPNPPYWNILARLERLPARDAAGIETGIPDI